MRRGAHAPLRTPRSDLRDNSLSGELPSELGQLTKQPYLSLRDNSLRGELPDDLSDAEIADAWAEAGLAVGAAADKTAFTRAWLALDSSTTTT